MNGIYVMDQMKDIEGIDKLLSNLPESCHHWDTFNFIDEFNYQTVFDDTDKYDYINNIEMVIRDEQKKYWLKMLLTDVSGRISFDTLNGFFHGLVIDDYGKGQERRYKFSCCEMDIDLYFYCAKISVELLYP